MVLEGVAVAVLVIVVWEVVVIGSSGNEEGRIGVAFHRRRGGVEVEKERDRCGPLLTVST